MEYLQHTISWPTFFWTCLIAGLVFLVSTRTKIGINFINTETRWTLRQWQMVLLVVVLSMFILVNPVFHLLALAVVCVLYYLLVHDKGSSKNIFEFGDSKNTIATSKSSSNNTPILLSCKSMNGSVEQNKEKLQRCLFSFPYVKDKPFPNIHLIDDRFETKLVLTSFEYTASLLEYLRHSGFEVEIKK